MPSEHAPSMPLQPWFARSISSSPRAVHSPSPRSQPLPGGEAAARTWGWPRPGPESIRLARRILLAEEELIRNREELAALVAASGSAQLLNEVGIGAVNAAVILVAWSHAGRIRSEAAFASLSGTCPIPASSGNTERHRLNRGGDRRLNRALSSIALTRMSHDPETRAYVERRRAEGKTPKEIKRLLKRYIARQVYRRLSSPPEIALAT